MAMLTTSTAFAAPATCKSFSATVTVLGAVSAGRTWMDSHGIEHIWGEIDNATISGDITGTMQITSYFNINTTAFTGNIQAMAMITDNSGHLYRMFAYMNLEQSLKLSGIFVIYGGGLKGTYVAGTVRGTLGGSDYLTGLQLVS